MLAGAVVIVRRNVLGTRCAAIRCVLGLLWLL